MKNVLILHSNYMPYNHIVSKELVKLGYKVFVIRYDKNLNTPYVAVSEEAIVFIARSSIVSARQLYELILKIQPVVIQVCGTMDKLYCSTCVLVRNNLKIPIVSGSDAQFIGNKRWLKVLLAPFRQKKYFDYFFVAGVRQYEYARRMGFDPEHILMHNLSADVDLFSQVNIDLKIKEYPKNILFIGRFVPIKGLNCLIDSWNSIHDKKGWTLTLVGNGELDNKTLLDDSILVKPFADQEELSKYLQISGCFVIPSIKEPWALVIHESAAAGLPIIASNDCGAVPHFVVNGFNGYTFSHAKVGDLKDKLEMIINTSDDELLNMSYNSRELSKRITPHIVAQTLISIIK